MYYNTHTHKLMHEHLLNTGSIPGLAKEMRGVEAGHLDADQERRVYVLGGFW